jgi:hypothetical protein
MFFHGKSGFAGLVSTVSLFQLCRHANIRSAEASTFATPLVEQYSVESIPCHTTYRLSVSLIVDSGAFNIHSVFGTATNPIVLPPAYQVTERWVPNAGFVSGFGAHVGGVSAALFGASPTSEFDSWLTVGPTDGSGALSPVGFVFDAWTSASGLTCDDCALLDFNRVDSDLGAPVVVAQLTVPTSAVPTTVKLSLQGHTEQRSAEARIYADEAHADWLVNLLCQDSSISSKIEI